MLSIPTKAIGALMLTSAIAAASPRVASAWSNQARKSSRGNLDRGDTQINCQTHAPLGPPFLSLLTFNSEGTMTETTSNPHFYPSLSMRP